MLLTHWVGTGNEDGLADLVGGRQTTHRTLSFASLLFNSQSAVILYFIEQTFVGYLKVYVLY